MVFTEMISSEGVIRDQKKTLAMMVSRPETKPIAIQLFGANPEAMGKAAAITVRDFGPDMVDINFGCPVKKVVNKNGGAAVLKDLTRTREIIAAVIEGAGSTPVSVKMRTGWEGKSPVYIEVGQIAQEAGAKAVILHARSRADGFSGKADWSAIRRLKEAVDIVVIGNGDVRTPADARRMIDETGCDGVMIGRASQGDPQIFGRVNHYLETGETIPEPGIAEKIALVTRHAELMVDEYGEQRGVLRMRKTLGWYFRGFKGASELRQRLVRVERLGDIEDVLGAYLKG